MYACEHARVELNFKKKNSIEKGNNLHNLFHIKVKNVRWCVDDGRSPKRDQVSRKFVSPWKKRNAKSISKGGAKIIVTLVGQSRARQASNVNILIFHSWIVVKIFDYLLKLKTVNASKCIIILKN